MGKNQKQVLNVLKQLGTADIKQISGKLPDFYTAQVRSALKYLNKTKTIKIVGHRPKTKLARTPLNVYGVA